MKFQWIVFVGLIFITTSVAMGQGGPTFYPKSAPVSHDLSTGREILGGWSPEPSTNNDHAYGYDPRILHPEPQGYGLSPMLLTGDPVTLLPYALNFANQYGIVPCIAVLLAIFIFQYIRSSQKNAQQREEFLHRQLDYSDKRTTEELTRLSSKLGMMEQDLRALQDRFDRHAELIRANGQLCREIVATMTAHNLAVEQGISELGVKLTMLTQTLRKKLKLKEGTGKQ
jgi:hypothetical protein